MNRIGVTLINAQETIGYIRTTMKLAANTSQHGHEWEKAEDVLPLVQKAPSDGLIYKLSNLPHPTLQKFGTIEVLFTGVSRRFLAHITRHQDMKFMVSSFRYGDHSDSADFVFPYEVLTSEDEVVPHNYARVMACALNEYREAVNKIGKDAAGYLLPSATRCSILASATAFQWKHVISQRVCSRAAHEIRYVMLTLWKALHDTDPVLFAANTTGPDCAQLGFCREGDSSCGRCWTDNLTPLEILERDYPEAKE